MIIIIIIIIIVVVTIAASHSCCHTPCDGFSDSFDERACALLAVGNARAGLLCLLLFNLPSHHTTHAHAVRPNQLLPNQAHTARYPQRYQPLLYQISPINKSIFIPLVGISRGMCNGKLWRQGHALMARLTKHTNLQGTYLGRQPLSAKPKSHNNRTA